MADIPKIQTALAEWLSCVTVVIAYRNLTKDSHKMLIAAKLLLSLMVLIMIQHFCGRVTNGLWLLGMLIAVIVMILTVQTCLKIEWKSSVYLNARGFMKAEFLAALQWQIFSYYYPVNASTVYFGIVSCVIFYIIGYTLLGLMEKRLMQEEGDRTNLAVTPRQAASVWVVALFIFLFSNMSYVSVSNPFTGTDTAEIFNIRTLFDLAGLLILEVFYLQKQETDRNREMAAINTVLQNQYMQYRMSQENRDIINRKYHDLKHQLQVLRMESNSEKREAYLDEIEQGINRYEMENRTGNAVLDTILTSKGEKCLKLDISMITVVNGSLLNHIHVMDLCTIFGNALDNAIEYEAQVKNVEKRTIHVTVSKKNMFACVVVENYFEGTWNPKQKMPETTKSNKAYHGYGLKSIDYSVRKYGGYMNMDVKNEWFRMEMLFPLPEK